MTKSRDKLVEAVESAERAHKGSQVIGHQVPLADTTERMIRAQFALMEHDSPGSGAQKLHEWVGKIVTGSDEELLEGFTGKDGLSSTRRAIGGRMRRMCEELFRDAGVEWTPPASIDPDGQGRML